MIETVFDQNPRETKLREHDNAMLREVREVMGTMSGNGTAQRNIIAGETVVTSGSMYRAIVNIPYGARLIEGMNVVRTSVEEQINVLQERE